MSLVLLCSLLAACVVARADERSVVVPEDNTPFTVSQNDVVRLTGHGISGGTITAAVVGPANVVSDNVVQRRVKGKIPIGALEKEFEIKPTKAGKVTVTITVTGPVSSTEPKAEAYEFEVK